MNDLLLELHILEPPMGSSPPIGNIYSMHWKHLLLWLETEKIALGTSVIDVLLHKPVILVKSGGPGAVF